MSNLIEKGKSEYKKLSGMTPLGPTLTSSAGSSAPLTNPVFEG